MAGEYRFPHLCDECLSCIRYGNQLCPGLIVFTREGYISASRRWREGRQGPQLAPQEEDGYCD